MKKVKVTQTAEKETRKVKNQSKQEVKQEAKQEVKEPEVISIETAKSADIVEIPPQAAPAEKQEQPSTEATPSKPVAAKEETQASTDS